MTVKPYEEGMIRVGANGNGLQVVIPASHKCWETLKAKKGVTAALAQRESDLLVILTFGNGKGSFWKKPKGRTWRNEKNPGPLEMDIQMTYQPATKKRDENITNFHLTGDGWRKVPCRAYYVGEDRVIVYAPRLKDRKPARYTNRGVVEDLKDDSQPDMFASQKQLQLRKSQIIDIPEPDDDDPDALRFS